MKRQRILACLLAGLLCFSVMAPILTFAADPDTIYVSSAADLMDLSKKCKLDTWSQGKTVILTQDIDVTGSKFSFIPTFGGAFEGQGYTVRGLLMSDDGSNRGFFRYLQESAVVKDLIVRGSVKPSGTKSTVGGLVGVNRGKIVNCTFNGHVKGTSYIGGIAGINEATGLISHSTSEGSVYGEHYVGGIAGENLGQILLSENKASINTTAEENKLDLATIDLKNLISTTNTDLMTDIGGVAGFSSGVVQSCTNSGRVGYEHVGYNVGGIVGRQSGYMKGCQNTGEIQGRKDVGGIIGQMVPYTELKYSATAIGKLPDELDTLQSLIDKAINDAQSMKTTVSHQMDSVQNHMDNAKDSADSLVDQTTDMLNNGIDNINDVSARIADTTDRLTAVMDETDANSQKVQDALSQYKEAMDQLSKASDNINTDNMKAALDDMSAAIDELQTSFDHIKKAMGYLEQGLGDVSGMQSALNEIKTGLTELSAAMNHIKTASGKIKVANEALKSLLTDGQLGEAQQIKDNLTIITGALDDISTSAQDAVAAVQTIISGVQALPTYGVHNMVNDMIDALDEMQKGVDSFQSAMSGMQNASDKLSGAWDNLSVAGDDIKAASDTAGAATDTLREGISAFTGQLDEINSILKDLSDKPTITFDNIGDDYLRTKDDLSDSLSGISSAFRELNNSVSDTSTLLINDIQAVTDQMFRVFTLLTDSIDETTDKSTNIEDYTQDVSDSDTAGQTNGKTEQSENHGKVYGDVDTGGVVGSMAIEYDFDPEDDVTKEGDKSLNFIYRTRAVVRDCVNYAQVTGKKNYVGGIAGKMDLGSILSCTDCGDVESSAGNYVGGLAGYSASTIHQSYAKCFLSGGNYVGGLVGEGKDIYDSAAIVSVTQSDEYTGSIAGKMDGAYTGNYYVSEDLGGVDGIDYDGKAQSKTYEELVELMPVPDAFRYFTLTFMAGGEVVDKVDFIYGSSLTGQQIPKVPERPNRFGVWSRESFENLTQDETVTAKYSQYITTIESRQQRDNGLPIVLEEGKLTYSSEMTLKKEEVDKRGTRPYQIERERWTVTITEDSANTNHIHYLVPEDAKDVIIQVKDGDKWRRVGYQTDGQYLVFDTKEDNTTFRVLQASALMATCLKILLLACCLTILVLIGLIIGVKRAGWPIKKRKLVILALIVAAIAVASALWLI